MVGGCHEVNIWESVRLKLVIVSVVALAVVVVVVVWMWRKELSFLHY